MAIPRYDPYGETDYEDWEDPFVHELLEGCPGCATCVGWKGKTYNQIRVARAGLVVGRRLRAAPEASAREIAREDRDYWTACDG